MIKRRRGRGTDKKRFHKFVFLSRHGRSHQHIWRMPIILFSPCVIWSEHKVLPFNMFITQFTVKWGARLNKLYLSITKHKSHFFYSSNFPLSPPRLYLVSISCPHSAFESLTKKQLKIIYYPARFNWLRSWMSNESNISRRDAGVEGSEWRRCSQGANTWWMHWKNYALMCLRQVLR